MHVIGLDLGIQPRNPSAAARMWLPPGESPVLLDTLPLVPRAGAWPERVAELGLAIEALIAQPRTDTYGRPWLLAYEAPHLEFRTDPETGETKVLNALTFRQLAALEGAILLAARHCHIEVVAVQPAQAKQALAGFHDASKKQMLDAAQTYFGLKRSSHEADAVGVALAGPVVRKQAQLKQLLEKARA